MNRLLPKPENTPFLTSLHEQTAEGSEGHSGAARSPQGKPEDHQGTKMCALPCLSPGTSGQKTKEFKKREREDISSVESSGSRED